MREPVRKPIFTMFFTPKPNQPGLGQLKWLRIPARGPLRVMTLLLASILTASWVGAALFAVAASRNLTQLAVGLAIVFLTLPLLAIGIRGWTVGTYVNDAGVKISRWWSTNYLPWQQIQSVDVTSATGGERVVCVTQVGDVATTVSRRSPNMWGRPHTWLSARDRLHLWWRETRES